MRVKGICSAYDLPHEDTQPERPYISFTATEVHPTAAIAAEKSHKAETWPFSSLSASRPCPFEERAKTAISFGGQEKPDFYMYGGTDGDDEPLYITAPIASEPAEIEYNPHESNSFRIWNPRRVELSKAGTLSSSKHHRTCFPLPGGFRRYRDTGSSSICLKRQQPRRQLHFTRRHDTRCARLHRCFGRRRQRPYTTTYSYASLARGLLAWGSHTESHRRNHRPPLHPYLRLARNSACTRACTGGTASNRHGHQPLRHAARC